MKDKNKLNYKPKYRVGSRIVFTNPDFTKEVVTIVKWDNYGTYSFYIFDKDIKEPHDHARGWFCWIIDSITTFHSELERALIE